MFPLQAAATLYIMAVAPNFDPNNPDPATAMKVFSVQLPLAIAALLSSSSIAVGWHRYILKDEIPQGWARLRLDATVLRYVGNLILLTLLLMGIFLLPAFLVVMISATMGQAALVLVVPIVAVLFVATFRCSIKFPAIALDRKDFGFKDAWRLTEGNNWQILGLVAIVLCVALIAGLVVALLALPFRYLPGDFSFITVLAMQFVVNWIMTIFSVTILTSLYGFYAENRSF